MRGEAKLQTGDRDGGKADLREALKVSPGYSHAAAVLFDACLADDELREARQVLAVLQEHAAGPEVAVKQIQLACRTDDDDGAIRAFARGVRGAGAIAVPGAGGARRTEDTRGWKSASPRVLRESWQTGGPFHPWVPIFWIDSPDGQEAEPGERLRAAEACIKAYPKFMPGHDCKAEQLALVGPLRRGARRVQAGGARPAADRTARPGRVDREPPRRPGEGDRDRCGSSWPRTRTSSWAGGNWPRGTTPPAGTATAWKRPSSSCRLEPANPLAYVYRGEARRSVADRRGALADFQKAFDLDPTFEAAGLNLITEQLATGDVAGAARTLAAVSEHADGPLVRLRAVQVACRQGDFDVAAARFRALAQDPEATRGMLRDAVQAFDAEGWGTRLTDELKDLAFAPDGTPEVAGLWAERTVAAGSPEAVSDRLPDLLAANPVAGREVVLAYVWALADAGKPVQSAVTKYSEVLRADAAAWARAGEALVATGNLAHAAAWLADWRDRDGVEAWMLRPLDRRLPGARSGRQGGRGVPRRGQARRAGGRTGRLPRLAGARSGAGRSGRGGRFPHREGGLGHARGRHAAGAGDGRGGGDGRDGRPGREVSGAGRGEGPSPFALRRLCRGGSAAGCRTVLSQSRAQTHGNHGHAQRETLGPVAAHCAVGEVISRIVSLTLPSPSARRAGVSSGGGARSIARDGGG